MTENNNTMYYIEDTKTNRDILSTCSLWHACELAVNRHDTNILIHIGSFNLDYYMRGDTTLSLYDRCKKILASL